MALNIDAGLTYLPVTKYVLVSALNGSGVIVGPNGEKVGLSSEVRLEAVPKDMGVGVFVRWLIKGEDGARAFAMRLFELEPGAHILPHKHPWEHEIYVLEGVGRVRIGGEHYDVGKDYFIFIPPNVEHEYWNTGESRLKFLCMIPLKPTA